MSPFPPSLVFLCNNRNLSQDSELGLLCFRFLLCQVYPPPCCQADLREQALLLGWHQCCTSREMLGCLECGSCHHASCPSLMRKRSCCRNSEDVLVVSLLYSDNADVPRKGLSWCRPAQVGATIDCMQSGEACTLCRPQLVCGAVSCAHSIGPSLYAERSVVHTL